MRQRVTLILDIDEEALAEHMESSGGNKPPYTSVVAEWDASDILSAAVDEGIVDPHECQVVSSEPVKEDGEES